MRIVRLIGLAYVLAVMGAQAQVAYAANYNDVLAALQNSSWTGSFTSGPAGAPTCHGSIDVRFFPMRKEAFAGGARTVSYRHQAHFSALTPFVAFCGTIGAAMSSVDISGCEKVANRMQTVENGDG